jgi:hypothetical protein
MVFQQLLFQLLSCDGAACLRGMANRADEWPAEFPRSPCRDPVPRCGVPFLYLHRFRAKFAFQTKCSHLASTKMAYWRHSAKRRELLAIPNSHFATKPFVMMQNKERTMNEIAKIISELEQQKTAIDRALSALREVEGPNKGGTSAASSPPSGTATPAKGQLSPEGRRRIAESNRRRAAAQKAAKAAQPSAAPHKGQIEKKALSAKKKRANKTPAKKTTAERRSPTR